MGGGAHGAPEGRTVGEYLGARLVEIGARKVFAVPGDFQMSLLDQLIKEPGLHMVGCCNELNAGYAADGYSRGAGIGACVVTHLVGGLSVLNAIAGAYAEHHPVVCVIGIPNTEDLDGPRLIHHTLANTDTTDQTAAFRDFTCHQERIKTVERAAEQIDLALGEALRRRRPVLIEIAANLAPIKHASLASAPVPYALQPLVSNQRSLEAAVQAAAEVLNKASSPALIGGPLLKPYQGEKAFQRLAEAMEAPVAVQASAKGMFPETHRLYLGVYWAGVSSPRVNMRLKSADALLAAGPLLNDMNTVGFTGYLQDEKTIRVDPSRVTICGGATFGCVQMADFLMTLPKALNKASWLENEGSSSSSGMDLSTRNYSEESLASDGDWQQEVADSAPYFGFAPADDPHAPLSANALYFRVQKLLSGTHEVVTDCGDSLFQVMKLRLPAGCGLQMQAQYASIGWSVGATLGLAAAHEGRRRVVGIIGDGAFQMTAQEIATMMRQRLNPIIIILNNGSYAIEEMVHKGPYNELKVWDYAALATAISNGDGTCFAVKVKTEADLTAALTAATGEHDDKLCFLDVKLAPNDCSAELLKFGADLGKFGMRPPKPR